MWSVIGLVVICDDDGGGDDDGDCSHQKSSSWSASVAAFISRRCSRLIGCEFRNLSMYLKAWENNWSTLWTKNQSSSIYHMLIVIPDRSRLPCLWVPLFGIVSPLTSVLRLVPFIDSSRLSSLTEPGLGAPLKGRYINSIGRQIKKETIQSTPFHKDIISQANWVVKYLLWK